MAQSRDISANIKGNGRKLPGRQILLILVGVAAIFLDFETSSLSSYRQGGATYQIGARHNVASPLGGEELSKMQNYQLQHQWSQYLQHLNSSNSSDPEFIVVNEHHLESHVKNLTDQGIQQNFSLIQSNTTIEEINLAEDPGVVKGISILALMKDGGVDENISNACFLQNSPVWLTGNRLQNEHSYLSHDFIFSQILMPNPIYPDSFSALSSQTICHNRSKFRNPSMTNWDVSNEQLLEEWEFRLIYMAIHYHHHEPASQEANIRQSCSEFPSSFPKMDYECPSTKFLVSNVAPSGFGAAMRMGAVNSILIGIATDRITLFVNNFLGGAKFLEKSSLLANCPRKDLQCFFLPTTPCTILVEDLRNATVLPEVHARTLRRTGLMADPSYRNSRILVLEPRLSPPMRWDIQLKIQRRLFSIAMRLIDNIRGTVPQKQIEFLEAAAARIKMENATIGNREYGENTTKYIYGNRYTKSAHAALMYLMRPNPNFQQTTDNEVSKILPVDLHESLAIGLPIRASDKCTSESVCFPFETYTSLINQVWTNNKLFSSAETKGDIILTSEDRNILDASRQYQDNLSFPFRFIVNENDILQGSGNPKHFRDRSDDIMLSSIVAIKLQFYSKFSIGNCCSNFHLVLFDLLREGCGAVTDNEVMCLQEYPDPRYQLCCGWTKSAVCSQLKEARKNETMLLEAK
jgi:hypothetical protein